MIKLIASDMDGTLESFPGNDLYYNSSDEATDAFRSGYGSC